MKRILLLLVYGLLVLPVLAQEPTTYLSLQTDATALQTGQYYEVRIQVDNAVNLWLVSAEIDYDPAALYIAGTKSGSPVTLGSLLSAGSSIGVLNEVQNQQLIYTASQLAPANPVTGSGVSGTFRVYPLKAGTTSLTIPQAQLIAVTFSGEGAARTAENSELPFQAVRLDLTIMGDPVEIPSEATATPEPTTAFVPVSTQPAEAPTLENLAAVPTAAPTLAPAAQPPAASGDNSGIMIIAIAFIVVAIIGIVTLFARRRS